MKKTFLLACLATLMLSSCTLLKSTATSVGVNTSIQSQNAVDLVVGHNKVSKTYVPTKQEQACGLESVVTNATAAVLKENNADVLVGREYDATYKINLFGKKKISQVTVTGYPAKYDGFRRAQNAVPAPAPGYQR